LMPKRQAPPTCKKHNQSLIAKVIAPPGSLPVRRGIREEQSDAEDG